MFERLPFSFAIFSIFGGVLISIFFGVNEDLFKNKIQEGLQQNVSIQAIVDSVQKEAKIEAEASKNWRYYQRFHFHATGIGAMMLGLLLFLTRLQISKKFRLLSSYMISIGGTLYPYLWLFAAIYGPSMGRHEAKESFALLGYMGGVFLVGALLALYASLRSDLSEA